MDSLLSERTTASSCVSLLLAPLPLSVKIRRLYERRRADRRRSIAWICRESGIPSKGYLGDVMAGRRRLMSKYAESLGSTLGLRGLDVEIFVALVALEDNPPRSAKLRLQARLNRYRKLADVKLVASRMPLPPMSYEVLSAFRLFGMYPSKADLLRYFGVRRRSDLDGALQALRVAGIIRLRSDRRWRLVEEKVPQRVVPSPGDLVGFLGGSIEDARRKLGLWHADQDSSYFGSVLVSVRRADFGAFLDEMRDTMLSWQARLESEQADDIVRINIQSYPVGHPSDTPRDGTTNAIGNDRH